MKHNFYNFGYLYNKLCLYLCNFTNILKFDCNFGPNGAEVNNQERRTRIYSHFLPRSFRFGRRRRCFPLSYKQFRFKRVPLYQHDLKYRRYPNRKILYPPASEYSCLRANNHAPETT